MINALSGFRCNKSGNFLKLSDNSLRRLLVDFLLLLLLLLVIYFSQVVSM